MGESFCQSLEGKRQNLFAPAMHWRRCFSALVGTPIDNLADEPEKQGRTLGGSLAGQRSCRAVGQRYRIIYRIDVAAAVVGVTAVGLRRAGDRGDVYALAERLARLGLL